MKRLFYILTSVVLLVACSSDDDGLKSAGNDVRVPLEIVASITLPVEGITRAAETAWEAGDKIGIFVTNRNTSTIYPSDEPAKGTNVEYSFDDGTNYETYGTTYRLFTPNSNKIYLSDTRVDVYGYYPYSETYSNPEVIGINVENQTSQNAIDFMRAKRGNVSNENASVELLFQHKLVKLVFNLKQGEGLLPDELKEATYLGMTIGNQRTQANYNIFTDAFTMTSDPSAITPIRASSAPSGYVRTFEAIVLPNGSGNSAQDRTVTITFYRNANDQIVNTFKIPGTTVFNSGYKYTFNVTVNATSIVVDKDKYTEQW